MKHFYRYRAEPLRWIFTNFLKLSATERYDLYYHADERMFQADYRSRLTPLSDWSVPILCALENTAELRRLLTPEDLARCAAASMRIPNADA